MLSSTLIFMNKHSLAVISCCKWWFDPVVMCNGRYAGTWSDKYKNRERGKTKATQVPPSRDYWGDFLTWRPPTELAKNQAFWLIVTMWLGLIGTAILLQRWRSEHMTGWVVEDHAASFTGSTHVMMESILVNLKHLSEH